VEEKVAVQDVGADLNKIANAVLEDAPESETAAAPVAAPTTEPETVNGAPAESGESAKDAREWIENWKEKSSA
jgi:hypothetical protein